MGDVLLVEQKEAQQKTQGSVPRACGEEEQPWKSGGCGQKSDPACLSRARSVRGCAADRERPSTCHGNTWKKRCPQRLNPDQLEPLSDLLCSAAANFLSNLAASLKQRPDPHPEPEHGVQNS